MFVYLLFVELLCVCVLRLYIGRIVRTLGLSILYVYVFREYCFQLIVYSGSTQGVVERVINVRYYYHYN